jgi:hypothetical protein
MTTTAIEERLAETGRRIDRLDARAQAGAAEARSRTQRHLDTLRQEEASARTAVRKARDAVEDKLRQLETKLDIAEHRLAAEFADDARTFADTVEAELHDWGTYLERLQMKAATKAKAGSAREQAEAAIRELRRHRNTVAEPLPRSVLPRARRGASGRSVSPRRARSWNGKSTRCRRSSIDADRRRDRRGSCDRTCRHGAGLGRNLGRRVR